MRFAAFALGMMAGLFGMWLWLPTVVAVFSGTEPPPDWTATLRVLALGALLSSVLAIAGAILSLRRSPLAWAVLAISAFGIFFGLGWVYFVGAPPAIALAIAAVLAKRSQASPA